MDIQLEKLLFTEAVPTPKEALKAGIAAIGSIQNNAVVLVSYSRTIKTIERSADLAFDLSNRAVVGFVRVKPVNNRLYQVKQSAGVNKYGVLAYQLVMHELKDKANAWLCSDIDLTNDSWDVWQKMYEYSDKNDGNLYKAKWLGAWGHEAFQPGMKSLEYRIPNGIYSKIYDYGLISDQEVLKALGKHASKAATLYAYQLKRPLPQVSQMFAKGKELLKKVSVKDVMDAGGMFFDRMYPSD
jgi:hypothetical protein